MHYIVEDVFSAFMSYYGTYVLIVEPLLVYSATAHIIHVRSLGMASYIRYIYYILYIYIYIYIYNLSSS